MCASVWIYIVPAGTIIGIELLDANAPLNADRDGNFVSPDLFSGRGKMLKVARNADHRQGELT